MQSLREKNIAILTKYFNMGSAAEFYHAVAMGDIKSEKLRFAEIRCAGNCYAENCCTETLHLNSVPDLCVECFVILQSGILHSGILHSGLLHSGLIETLVAEG